MGSQAMCLIRCSFHPCTLAPEGGAPASRTWAPSRRGVGSPTQTAAGSGAPLVHDAFRRFPVGTPSHRTGKQECVGTVPTCPPRGPATGRQKRHCREDFWLKPPPASPLGLKPRGVRRAKAYSVSSALPELRQP